MSGEQTMRERVENYIRMKRNIGYSMRGTDKELLRFARFAESVNHNGAVTTALVLSWAQSASTSSQLYRARRLEVARTFARYEASFMPDTQIPPRGILGPAHRRVQPHIYSKQEIHSLIGATRRLTPHGGLRPRTYEVLIGLLASTGLRVCEALRLDRSNLDAATGRLVIRETKFHKSRVIPIHQSTTRSLVEYAQFRDQYHPLPWSTRFLLSEQGRELKPSVVHYTFQKLRAQVGLESMPNARAPRLYDLRHTFACGALLRWYTEGVDVNHHLPFLSTYLGHVKPTDTYWYLSAVPQLMELAMERFEEVDLTGEGSQS